MHPCRATPDGRPRGSFNTRYDVSISDCFSGRLLLHYASSHDGPDIDGSDGELDARLCRSQHAVVGAATDQRERNLAFPVVHVGRNDHAADKGADVQGPTEEFETVVQVSRSTVAPRTTDDARSLLNAIPLGKLCTKSL